MGTSADTALKIKNVSVVFDGFQALTDVDVKVKRNSIHFFIGPNGAGKTTLLDIICAKTKPTKGNVTYYPEKGEKIRLTGMKEYKIVNEGVVRKFQVPSVFVNLTVFENMELSLKGNKQVFQSIFHRTSKEEKELINETLRKVGLEDRKDVLAGSLAHGEKQWLEIAMQFVQKPEIIMLYEPADGMGKPETFKTGELLKEINKAVEGKGEGKVSISSFLAALVKIKGEATAEVDIDTSFNTSKMAKNIVKNTINRVLLI